MSVISSLAQVNNFYESGINLIKDVSIGISKHYENKIIAVAGGVIGAVAATEMAIQVAWQLYHFTGPKAATNLSAHLAGSVFFALAASNLLPYMPQISGFSYVLYSLTNESPYLSARLINTVAIFVIDYFLTPFFSHVVKPLINHVIIPLAENVIIPLGERLISICRLERLLSLPFNPMWEAVAALVVGIVVYKAVGLSRSHL